MTGQTKRKTINVTRHGGPSLLSLLFLQGFDWLAFFRILLPKGVFDESTQVTVEDFDNVANVLHMILSNQR